VKLPIIPIIIYGAFSLWPAKQWYGRPGKVVIRVLPQIDPKEGEDYEGLASRVRRAMLKGAVPPLNSNIFRRTNALVDFLVFPLCYCIVYWLYARSIMFYRALFG